MRFSKLIAALLIASILPAANAASLGAEPMNSVTGVGAP